MVLLGEDDAKEATEKQLDGKKEEPIDLLTMSDKDRAKLQQEVKTAKMQKLVERQHKD